MGASRFSELEGKSHAASSIAPRVRGSSAGLPGRVFGTRTVVSKYPTPCGQPIGQSKVSILGRSCSDPHCVKQRGVPSNSMRLALWRVALFVAIKLSTTTTTAQLHWSNGSAVVAGAHPCSLAGASSNPALQMPSLVWATTKGTFTVRLRPDLAPHGVRHLLRLVEATAARIER
jgi:hypothetical protein